MDKLASYWHPHLTLATLDFLLSSNQFDKKSVLDAKLKLLASTKLTDATIKTWSDLNPSKSAPSEYKDAKEKASKEIDALKKKCEALLKILDDAAAAQSLSDQAAANLSFLQKHNIQSEDVVVLKEYAQILFETGHYADASKMLHFFLLLTPDTSSTHKTIVTTRWGKLISEIILKDWDASLADLTTLSTLITSTHADGLNHRLHLLHTSLFVFFNHPKGFDGLIDLWLSPTYMTILTYAPWLMRYLGAVSILNKKKRGVRDLLRLISASGPSTMSAQPDSLVSFVEGVNEGDFDKAETYLKKLKDEDIRRDFFLNTFYDDFVENARVFLFETYVRIYHTIELSRLAKTLCLSDKEDVRTVAVNWMKQLKVDGRLEDKYLVITETRSTVYQELIEKTKEASSRAAAVVSE